MFFGYNWKLATTTCPCPILPPLSRSRMMEPLSHYHCEIYHCKYVPINMNQASTCASTYTINQCTINKCIQPCTKYVPIMCQLLINQHHQLYTSCMCQLINYLSQPCTQHVTQPKSIINFIIQL
jgi:hypothetical protein